MNSSQQQEDYHWMEQALQLAHRAESEGEVPVGALVVNAGERIGSGWNCPIGQQDPSAHAEIQAIRAAAKQMNNYRIPGTTLYVTLEPCPMCAGAILQARIARVVFAATDPRSGAAGSCFQLLQSPKLNHRCVVESGVMAEESGTLLRQFFRQRRGSHRHRKGSPEGPPGGA
ncbi:MAG: tRNA adenosine(34) deaminase TadA [Gammaproteobacteria bacterium]|jgi:tRNA(adenine34) deaminase|nr:tRNA adenosine(34) deaminase TadA [Gammaproteobacteria bacterium]